MSSLDCGNIWFVVDNYRKFYGKSTRISDFSRIQSLADLRFGVCADTAWAKRADSINQDRFLIFFVSKYELNNGKAMKLSIIDLVSRKLARICRLFLLIKFQLVSIILVYIGNLFIYKASGGSTKRIEVKIIQDRLEANEIHDEMDKFRAVIGWWIDQEAGKEIICSSSTIWYLSSGL